MQVPAVGEKVEAVIAQNDDGLFLGKKSRLPVPSASTPFGGGNKWAA